jgi:agmatine deiminase
MVNVSGAASSYPANQGFSWPAEWETHRRTWMCWPSRIECFGGDEGTLRAKQAYARVARAISAFEPVTLAVRPEEAAEAKLATAGKVQIFETPLDDGWARDIGPTFLRDHQGKLAGVQWIFNGWGGKYQPFTHDAMFARRVLEAIGARNFSAPLICEGGALHSDGEGTIITTEQCLLNKNRNAALTREDVEMVLQHYLGARKVIWLPGVFSDDETDGHIDNIACFAAPGRVIVGVPHSRSHPDYQVIRDAMQMLGVVRDAKGRNLDVVGVPQPKQQRMSWSGRLLQTSYVNFYLANGALIVPAFDDAHDDPARTILGDCFPGRDIMQVEALDIVQGGGGIHCITQQEPAA